MRKFVQILTNSQLNLQHQVKSSQVAFNVMKVTKAQSYNITMKI